MTDANPACDDQHVPKEWRTVDRLPSADDLGYPDERMDVALGNGQATMFDPENYDAAITVASVVNPDDRR